MGLAFLASETLEDMGDAIREKNGLTQEYTPTQMPAAIRNLTVDTTGMTLLSDVEIFVLDLQNDAYTLTSGSVDYYDRKIHS